MKKYILVPDSFKGHHVFYRNLSDHGARHPDIEADAEIHAIPIADGGEKERSMPF